jgi:RNA polymerase sigma factor (sigma-70 family)
MNPGGSLDDAEVMSHVRDGRIEMLAILFERHHVRLFNFFLRLTQRREWSEDLVQELFLRVLKYRHSFRPNEPFTPWMYQIARHLHLSHLRQRRPELPLDDVLDHAPDSAESPVRRLERRQEQDLLGRALERLPLRKRELLLLSRHEDLKYKDLAVMFECSVGALKVEVHRAVKDLRKAFLELQGGAA